MVQRDYLTDMGVIEDEEDYATTLVPELPRQLAEKVHGRMTQPLQVWF